MRPALWMTLILSVPATTARAQDRAPPAHRSVRDFGVLPTNTPAANKTNLQKAIDWASPRGAALYVDPSDEPYPIEGGLVLRRNVSLVGVHGPVGRGTRHPDRPHPVGTVFAITDEKDPFITVEAAAQLRGIQFWYPKQTLDDPKRVIEYPPTIRVSQSSPAQGVTLSRLTFYGEFIAMDFNADPKHPCEQILFEHCYGYPLSGQFIRIDHCYDIPRILHCHVNPANQRFFRGSFAPAVKDAVVARKTFAFTINHTDNAQLIDLFAFATHGGAYLGPDTYGQLTNFNFDCVTIGVHKLGAQTFNRNWQIAQGSIIANTGPHVEDVHPFIIEGQGHTSIANVEAFSGPNDALTTLNKSHDFMLIRGTRRATVSLVGARMRNYVAKSPITVENPQALVQAVACVDKDEAPFNETIKPLATPLPSE